MGTGENHLDNLLESVTESDEAKDVETKELPEESEITDIPEMTDALGVSDISIESDILEDEQTSADSELTDILEELDLSEISEVSDALEITDLSEELEIPEISEMPETSEDFELSELNNEENGIDPEAAEQVHDEADISAELDIDDIADFDMPEISDELTEEPENVLNIDDIADFDMPENLNDENFNDENDETKMELTDELNIAGLEAEETSQSETELGMSDELNLDELDLDTSELDIANMDDDLGILDGMDDDTKDNSPSGIDDGLDDVLSMLDDDADLAEINDILKKSDSNEPIQDEMMDLLNQMADDEAALVNAGVKNIEEDGGVPIPDMPSESEAADDSTEQTTSKKKKNSKDQEKKPGVIGKLFNLLTDELPGPTEEDYAAEEEKKAAKKQEALTKKEQDKLAKDEEKQAKAVEKEAAKKAKAEAAAQKKKEKQEAKEKKAAEKLEKQGPVKKAKRIPPKKIAAVALFGASVFGGVMVATNVLSNQGYINVAKKAFYDGNYKEVYLATYGMNLNDSDALIQKKSEIILKMQRWYDSYQNNLKLGREREALDALIRSIASYDYINAEAEAYGVLNEIDSIKDTILGVLQSEYGLSEEQARELLNYEDALDYTIALNNIITGK